MEIIFIPKEQADDLMNFPVDEIRSLEFDEIKSELEQIDESYLLKSVNLGAGADWVLILAILNGLTTVFLLGDKIDKGLEGWAKIGKRIKKLFSKSDKVYLDRDAVCLLALDYLSDNYQPQSVKLVIESNHSIKDLSLMLFDRAPNDFISKPFSIHFLTFEVDDRLLVTLSIRSDGKINEIDKFDSHESIPF